MTKPAVLLRAATIPLLMLCAACGGNDRVQIAAPPVALTTCSAEPVAPDLPPVPWASVETARPVQASRDRAMLDYVLAWRSAHGDCAAKVAGLAAWVEGVR